jgi:transcriptional regulator with XRE-family HTH domain
MTQQQLANLLGKTSAAISDLERGKVQVSAGDLSIIATALDRPIEFFYGANFKGEDVQDIIAYMQNETPEQAKQSLETMKMFMRLQHLGEIFQKEDRQPTPEEMGTFVTDFMKFSDQINDLTKQMNLIRDQLLQALKEQGKDILG